MDTVLNPLLQQLVMSLKTHLAQHKATIRQASKLVYRKVSYPERFFHALLRLVTQWTEICVNTFGPECTLPVPVLIFDDSHVLLSRYASLVKLFARLPSYVSSHTNVGSAACRSTDITVIFCGRTPVVHDLVPPPIVHFSVYQKQSRDAVLRSLFRSVGWPVVEHLSHQGFDEQPVRISNSFEDFSDTSDLSSEDSTDTTGYDTSSDSDSSSSSISAENAVVSDVCVSEDDSNASFVEDVQPESACKTVRCVSDIAKDQAAACEIVWKQYNYVDGPLEAGLDRMDISYQVLEQLWHEFLRVLAPHLGRHTLSDFHETLFIVRRLWAVYVAPLLYLDPAIVGFLRAGDLEGALQELRAKLEKHHCCTLIPKTCFSRHLEPPPSSASAEDFLPSLFPRRRLLASLAGLPLYVSVHRFEGSTLSLVLLVAAFVATTTPVSHDRSLAGTAAGRSGRRQPRNGTCLTTADLAYVPAVPFTLLRWMWICQTLFLLLGQPLPASLLLFEQVAALMNINFVMYADRQSSVSGLGALSGTTKLICLAPVDVIADVSQRIDLPLSNLISLGQ